MSLEDQVKRIADALEIIAAAMGGVTPDVNPLKPEVVVIPKTRKKTEKAKEAVAENDLFATEEEKAEEKTDGVETKKVVSIDDVRDAVKAYAEANTPVKAQTLLKKFGVERIRELKPEQYYAVIAAFKV